MDDNAKINAPAHTNEALPEDLYASGLRATYVGMAVNALLIVVKMIGGVSGASAALVADAVHSFSDLITDVGVIVGLRFISKPADEKHAYGHGRIETAISLLMGLGIVITGMGMLRSGGSAILRSFSGEYPPEPGYIALAMAFVSIFSKEALFHYTRIIARKSGSRALEANAWHHRSDALSSVGTVIGVGGAIVLGSSWTILDAVAAVFVSMLVIKVGFDIGWNAFRELSDEALSNNARTSVINAITSVEGVKGTHNLRTRSLGRYATVDAHVQVDAHITVLEGHNIATEVENAVRQVLESAAFVTIHVEPCDESNDCFSP